MKTHGKLFFLKRNWKTHWELLYNLIRSLPAIEYREKCCVFKYYIFSGNYAVRWDVKCFKYSKNLIHWRDAFENSERIWVCLYMASAQKNKLFAGFSVHIDIVVKDLNMKMIIS